MTGITKQEKSKTIEHPRFLSIVEIPEVSDSDSGNLSDTYFSFLKLDFKLL